jgi:geranylgeranyl pyrophosphate synthase
MKSFENFPWIQNFIAETDGIISEAFENTGSADLKDILRNQHRGGKRLRPMIVAASGQLGEKTTPELAYGAAAIELLHLASLFHDDVLDDTDSRRFQLAAQKKNGNFISILTGDYLLAECLNMLVTHLPSTTAAYFLSTIKRMIKSEIMSNKHLFNMDISKKEYLQIIDDKTASLFALAGSLGIRITSQNDEQIQSLTDFGYHLGMAYQIVDDLQDMMGLIAGSDNDLAHGYMSLPVIELLNAAGPESKTAVKDYLRNLTEDNKMNLLLLMKSFSVFKITFSEIKKHLDGAKNELRPLATDDGKSAALVFLGDLCDQLKIKADAIIAEYEKIAECVPEKPVEKKFAFA